MENPAVTQICIVVHDAAEASRNWAATLGRPVAEVITLFPEGALEHVTDGEPAEYTDLRVAKYDLGNLVIELMQPGAGPSPWRKFLDANGPGVFHACVRVEDRAGYLDTLGAIGVPAPYHVGQGGFGSYSYVRSRDQLGIELSINASANQ